ncbi:hypothetical protein [Shivajiella indica]|uniref:Uncharacterized protein n=1 Tax=Shivajiella indica TaxID=872115 RepID=A0ABW5B687_9BACT
MKNLSNKEIFKTPTGYFEELPQKTLLRYENEKSRSLSLIRKIAAAAVIVIGLGIYSFYKNNQEELQLEANLNNEIDLYINSDHWQAEDILILSENPNSILDEILLAEWETLDMDENDDEVDQWF